MNIKTKTLFTTSAPEVQHLNKTVRCPSVRPSVIVVIVVVHIYSLVTGQRQMLTIG